MLSSHHVVSRTYRVQPSALRSHAVALHRVEVQVLKAAADEEVVGIEDDEVVEVGRPCALVSGGAVQRV